MSSIGSNKLIKNENDKAIFDVLNSAKAEGEKVMAWKVVGSSKITAELELSLIKKYDKKIVLNCSEDQMAKLRNIVSGSDSINLFLMDRQVLFQSEIVSLNNNEEFIVRFPKMVAQAERRKSLRLVTKNDELVRVDFFKSIVQQKVKTQHFQKPCYDISRGGLSFIVSKLEAKFFEVEDDVMDIQLQLEDKQTVVGGKIVNLIPVEPNAQNNLIYKGFRVCIQFSGVSTEVEEAINRFVFENIELDEAV